MLPTKKYIKGNLYYNLVLQIGENESMKIIAYNQKMYDKVKELSEKQSPVKIETKVSQKDNSLFFNDDCNVYSAESYDVLFKYNNQIKLSPSDSCVRQSTKNSIDDILKMIPNCGELVAISAVLAVGDSSYAPVNTRHGVAEIKKDCVVEDTTGFKFCRLLKSVCKNNQDLPAFSHGAKAVSRRVIPFINLEYYCGGDIAANRRKFTSKQKLYFALLTNLRLLKAMKDMSHALCVNLSSVYPLVV